MSLELLRPDVFAGLEGYVAAFSTRQGGVSRPPFATLNLGLSTGDDPACVQENRRRVGHELGLFPDRWATAGQVHGAEVAIVREPGHVSGVDGLVTDRPGILLAVTVADCAAVLLADPEAGVVGAAHAGWRGAVSGILRRTVETMRRLGARPDRILAYVSPAIGTCHFEVGPEVAEHFPPPVVHPGPQGRPHVDLKEALRRQLIALGLHSARIEVSPLCTADDPGRFFSFRAQKGQTGRMMGLIGRLC